MSTDWKNNFIKIWEAEQEIICLSHIPLKDYNDYRKIGNLKQELRYKIFQLSNVKINFIKMNYNIKNNLHLLSKKELNKKLFIESRRGHLDNIQNLIKTGADVNAKSKSGWTSLMWASRFGHLNIAKILINIGANVNITDNDGRTALIHSSSNGYINIVQLLLDADADINIKDECGQSALTYALYYGHTDIYNLIKTQ